MILTDSQVNSIFYRLNKREPVAALEVRGLVETIFAYQKRFGQLPVEPPLVEDNSDED
jgi:hypothetical protein